jgi:hypothetical protein
VQDAVAVAMGQRGCEEIGEGEAPLVAATHQLAIQTQVELAH